MSIPLPYFMSIYEILWVVSAGLQERERTQTGKMKRDGQVKFYLH